MSSEDTGPVDEDVVIGVDPGGPDSVVVAVVRDGVLHVRLARERAPERWTPPRRELPQALPDVDRAWVTPADWQTCVAEWTSAADGREPVEFTGEDVRRWIEQHLAGDGAPLRLDPWQTQMIGSLYRRRNGEFVPLQPPAGVVVETNLTWLSRWLPLLVDAFARFAPVVADTGRGLAGLMAAARVEPDPAPVDPMRRALQLRRDRGTGPRPVRRAPRRIDATKRRGTR